MSEPNRTVDADLPCLGCGYNLRTSACPECGVAVEFARSDGPARAGDDALKTFGLSMLVYAFALAVALVVAAVAALPDGPGIDEGFDWLLTAVPVGAVVSRFVLLRGASILSGAEGISLHPRLWEPASNLSAAAGTAAAVACLGWQIVLVNSNVNAVFVLGLPLIAEVTAVRAWVRMWVFLREWSLVMGLRFARPIRICVIGLPVLATFSAAVVVASVGARAEWSQLAGASSGAHLRIVMVVSVCVWFAAVTGQAWLLARLRSALRSPSATGR